MARQRKRFTQNQRGIVARLLNGPWPVRARRDLIADTSYHRADFNAGRAMQRLKRVGLVEVFSDPATDDENYRIKVNRFGLAVISHLDDLHRWETHA